MPYQFYFDGNEIPVTPGSVKIKTAGANKTVTLIDQGEINILKLPKLKEISFDVLLPTQIYPFANNSETMPSTWLDTFENYKQNKTPFQFVITRTTDAGKNFHGTSIRCSLEDYETDEDADEYGTDVNVSVTLKEYKDYGTKTVVIHSAAAASVTAREQDNAPTTPTEMEAGKADNPVVMAKTYHNTSATAPGVADTNGYKTDKSYSAATVSLPTKDTISKLQELKDTAKTAPYSDSYIQSRQKEIIQSTSTHSTTKSLFETAAALKAVERLEKVRGGHL